METDTPSEADRLPSPWIDASCFSRGEKDRTPKTWKVDFGRFVLCVTRHKDYAPDVWVISCHGVFGNRVAESKNLVEAADQAVRMLQSLLETSVEALREARHKPTLLECLIDLRRSAREAQKTAQSTEHYNYPVVRALDPLVNGTHDLLLSLGVGFMEYEPNLSEPSKSCSSSA